MPCVGSNPTLAAKPKCALGLVECGVKSIDKIEVICLSFRCCSAERIEWRQPFYDYCKMNLIQLGKLNSVIYSWIPLIWMEGIE